MENASKALIMIASVLIGIMLLSFMVYLFRRFNITAKETDQRISQREAESFNAKFLNYETGGTHTDSDVLTITYQKGSGSLYTSPDKTQTKDVPIPYKKVFDGSIESQSYYNKALIAASKSLNTVSDVVTAINDAIDVNDRNNNSYKYNGLEVQNSVEIIVDLGSYKDEFEFSKIDGSTQHYQYLVIEPSPNVTPRYIYGVKAPHTLTTTMSNTENKQANVKNLVFENDSTKSEYNAIKVYSLLSELRETKTIQDSFKDYTVYKYYFTGEVFLNDYTGLVETVKFNLMEDKNF